MLYQCTQDDPVIPSIACLGELPNPKPQGNCDDRKSKANTVSHEEGVAYVVMIVCAQLRDVGWREYGCVRHGEKKATAIAMGICTTVTGTIRKQKETSLMSSTLGRLNY